MYYLRKVMSSDFNFDFIDVSLVQFCVLSRGKSIVEKKIIINLECKLLKVVVDTDSQQN